MWALSILTVCGEIYKIYGSCHMENLHLSVIKKLMSFVPIDGMGEIARGKYCCWIFFCSVGNQSELLLLPLLLLLALPRITFYRNYQEERESSRTTRKYLQTSEMETDGVIKDSVLTVSFALCNRASPHRTLSWSPITSWLFWQYLWEQPFLDHIWRRNVDRSLIHNSPLKYFVDLCFIPKLF